MALTGAWLIFTGANTPAVSTVSVKVEGLTSSKGVLRWCVSDMPAHFPECAASLPSGSAVIAKGTASFAAPVSERNTIAIAVFHDANGNGKLDTALGIPREGYGFSRNPPFRPRAPRFDESAIGPTTASTVIRMRYIF